MLTGRLGQAYLYPVIPGSLDLHFSPPRIMVLQRSSSAQPTPREGKDRFRFQRKQIWKYAQLVSQEECSVKVVIYRSGTYYVYHSEDSDKWLPSRACSVSLMSCLPTHFTDR